MMPIRYRLVSIMILDKQQVIDLIRKEQGRSSLRDYAKSVGISAAYLSDVLRGNRAPGKKIYEHFGLSREKTLTVTYTFTKDKK
jgi:transcriptional regulator with XRE-family HTH domain